MDNKPSRKIIEEAIRDAIEGKPLSEDVSGFVKGVVGGVKGVGQVAAGNYRVTSSRAKVQDFAQKTTKKLDKLSQDVAKSAGKMVDSSNPAVSSTGNTIQNVMKATADQLRNTLGQLPDKFPAAVTGTVAPKGQLSAQAPQIPVEPKQKSEFQDFLEKIYSVSSVGDLPQTIQNQVIKDFNKERDEKRKTSREQRVQELVKKYSQKQEEGPKESLVPEKLTHKINFPSSIKSLVGETIAKVLQNEAGAPAIPPPPPENEDAVSAYLKAPGATKEPSLASLKAPLIPKSEKQTVPPPKRKQIQQTSAIKKESFSSMEDLMNSDLLKDQILNSIQERKKLSGKK